MDNNQLEEIFNSTFSGLTLFYRDANLSENLISKYHVGQIIMERGFTDMSYKGGGLSTNFRYLIASANGKDLSAFNPKAADAGHIVLTSNAYFKVLDITKIGNQTQVFLLNIPENAIEFFKTSTSNVEKEIIEKAKAGFAAKIKLPALPETHTEEWLARTKFPLGMSDDGELFYKENGTAPVKPVQPKTAAPAKPTSVPEKPSDVKKPWWKIW